MSKGWIKVGEHSLFETCKIPLFAISGMCFKTSIYPFSRIFLIMKRLNMRVKCSERNKKETRFVNFKIYFDDIYY